MKSWVFRDPFDIEPQGMGYRATLLVGVRKQNLKKFWGKHDYIYFQITSVVHGDYCGDDIGGGCRARIRQPRRQGAQHGGAFEAS